MAGMLIVTASLIPFLILVTVPLICDLFVQIGSGKTKSGGGRKNKNDMPFCAISG